jgi:thiamine transport system ATP-binding protein
MLSLREVSVRFEETVAVDRVSLDVPDGQVLAVLGPSGSGKSTLLRAVAGLEAVASGSVLFDGVDVTRVPAHRRGFALMFQDGQLFAHRSVAANVGYALGLRGQLRRTRARRVEELLELVGLAGFGPRSPATLSGGERQRVALARALAVEPRMLLLDEPLSALDRTLRERLAVDLRDILVAAGTTALLVTHDHEEAFAMADSMALMRRGRLVQVGSVDQVWQQPVDAEAASFLGYATVLAEAEVRALLGSRAPSGALALRRSALHEDPTGELTATVLSARLTPEQVRLVVDRPGAGQAHAVADRGSAVEVGGSVRLRLDLERTAELPAALPVR